jgi:hypothetical protein
VLQGFVYATGPEVAESAKFPDLERYLWQSLADKCMVRFGFHYPVTAGDSAAGTFDNELFPDIDRMKRTGQLVPGGPGAAVLASRSSKASGAAVPANQRAAYSKDVRTCTLEVSKTFSAVDHAAYALQTQWFLEVSRIQASAQVSAKRAEFTGCLKKAGVPSESAGSFSSFMAWQTGEMTYAKDEQALVVTDHKWAVVFVRCAGSLVQLQEKLQTQAKRKFLQEHFQQVKALQDDAGAAVAEAQKQLGASAG